MKLPEGTFAVLEGTFKAQEQASRTIGVLGSISLLMIFAILYSRYHSAVLALIGLVPGAAGVGRARLEAGGENDAVHRVLDAAEDP